MNSVLRDSDAGGILERFDVISKLLFLKVMDEREVRNGQKTIPEFFISPEDTPQSVMRRVSALWERTCRAIPSLRPKNGAPSLTQDAAALHRIVGLLESVQLSDTPGDVKGLAYEELLRNTFDKSENQQYFTPHEIVQFMVDVADIDHAASVCDPACGTGGFLVEVTGRGWNGATLVGADVDERLARVAQLNLLMHGCERAQVYRLPGTGSLAPFEEIEEALPVSSFDLVLTNPPFGSDLLDPEALACFKTGRGRASRRRSVLFTERCIELVRPGGRVIIVLDDSVLNLPTNADIRSLIRSRTIVEAVVSLPDVSFMPYSSAKCSVVVLRRKRGADDTQGPIFMADAGEVGRRPNGDPLYSDERDAHGNRVVCNDLPGIARAYEEFRTTGSLTDRISFVTWLPEAADRLDIFHYHPVRFEAERELAECRWPTAPLRELAWQRSRRGQVSSNVRYSEPTGSGPRPIVSRVATSFSPVCARTFEKSCYFRRLTKEVYVQLRSLFCGVGTA
jgi:tRNA1(Val) A37 N6-methylase TrmN6